MIRSSTRKCLQRNLLMKRTLSSSPILVNRQTFDINSTYFGEDIQLRDAAIGKPSNPHKQLINLLKYIPVQLEEVQKRAATSELHIDDGVIAIKYGGLYLRQITIEDQQHEQAVNDYTEELQNLLKMGRGVGIKHFKKVLISWFEPLTSEIIREVDLVHRKVKGLDRECYGPCLLLLPPEKLSVITLNTVLNLILKYGNGGVRISLIASEIGNLVKTEINLMKLKQSKEVIPKWQQDMIDVKGNVKRFRALSRHVLKRYEEEWEEKTRIKVGSALCQFLIEVARDDKNVPLLEHRLEISNAGGKPRMHGVLYLEQKFFEEISTKDLYYICPRFLPMVIPPRAWSNRDLTGGYFRLRAPIVRTFSHKQNIAVKEAYMPQVLEGLDALGAVPWLINRDVLKIIKDAWEMNLKIGELPSTEIIPMPTEEECFRVPPPPEPLPSPISEVSISTDSNQINIQGNDISKITSEAAPENGPGVPVFDEKLYKYRCRLVKKKNTELHSLRCDLKLKLWVADQFSEEEMYFPHNLDFRGRAYPVPQNLSHLGSDLCRGLLKFSQKKPLGSVGLRWMKIHLANLFGHNKVTFDDRVAWVEANWENILDSGRKPLEGQRWWATAENPFQALAVCIDLAKAAELPNPEEYESNVPVHQDGSCNGLQHYAALGCDFDGAKAVNLVPSEKPQDVYSVVLEVALAKMAEHACIPADCDDLAERTKGVFARFLTGKVDRKVVKQTVMTSVYGVTRIGARAQVQMRLEEKFKTDPQCADLIKTPEFELELYRASMYLASLTLDSLTVIFASAKDIMDWLAKCAELVSHEGHSMSWITPLGLPVIQPYRYECAYTVQTLLQKITLVMNDDVLPVSTTKQKSAFPPNYVHSLDASHMLLTCLRMKDRKLCFAAVHDSFWTHAADAPTLGKLLRESFVELYGAHVLEQLRDSLQRRFPQVEFPPVPTRGKFDVKDVLSSDYFFH